MTKKSPSLRIALVIASGILLVLALAPIAGAARGGATSTSGSPITFNPTTVSLGQVYQINVTGLSANTWTSVGAYYISTDAAYWCSAYSDGTGHFSCTFTAMTTGNIRHEVYQLGNNSHYRLKATAYLTVSP